MDGLAGMSTAGIKLRLFLTCWLVYVLHFATDFAREHYLVISMAEEATFRLDPYVDLHPDLFRNPPTATEPGVHHGANPGISMVAAVPYFLVRPAVDYVSNRVVSRRGPADTTTRYDDTRQNRVKFYRQLRARGLDIKFGLVGAVTAALCMAPLTAASAVGMFSLLLGAGLRRALALGLAALFAFGTPMFFRAAYLNQNLGVAIFAFGAFILLWNPNGMSRWPARRRHLVAGLLGGLCFLCDYSGALATGLLGLYALARARDDGPWGRAIADAATYGAGAMVGVLLLWWYQWQSFGNPFLPPQHWMPPVEGSNIGYQGVGGIDPSLLLGLLFDLRYGLFAAMPLAIMALAAPFTRREGALVPPRELLFCFALTAAFVLFFSTVFYTTLQWVTGIRYLAPVIPFMFLPAAAVLLRTPRWLAYGVAALAVTLTWSLSMVRSQGTVFENVVRVFVEGFQLPWLTVLAKTSLQYAPWLRTVSPLPLFALLGATVAAIWLVRRPGTKLVSDPGQ